MMGVRQFDQYAGRCFGRIRHRWRSGEIRMFKDVTRSRYETSCTRCQRVRVREYTLQGNHIIGYRTEPKRP